MKGNQTMNRHKLDVFPLAIGLLLLAEALVVLLHQLQLLTLSPAGIVALGIGVLSLAALGSLFALHRRESQLPAADLDE
jgi:hypothetical protein